MKKMKIGIILMLMVLAISVLLFKTSLVVVHKVPVTSLKLERVKDSHDVNEVIRKDSRRMERVLKEQLPPQVVEFYVFGGYKESDGLYYAKIQLGTPSKNYYVMIDTGTDALWVDCRPCNDCYNPTNMNADVYIPSRSSTSRIISCSEGPCSQPAESSDTNCSTNHCGYTIRDIRGSIKSSGYYVSDMIQVTTVGEGSRLSTTSANVIFGCSTYITPKWDKSLIVLNGVFGFGQQGFSVMSQLSSQGVTPNVFMHCLSGSIYGGGSLIIGHILEPNVIYTPLVKSQSRYHVNLESISVKGHPLSIDPATFALTDNRGGTIIDSGTSRAYLPKDAHSSFVNAITESVSKSVQPFGPKGNRCFVITSSLSKSFPNVSLNFVGGATMQLRPQDYLFQKNEAGPEVWCIGFYKSHDERMTILGDIVLKDKIIVYDLGGQRIGWLDHDCSSDIDVINTSCSGRSKINLFFMMYAIFLSIYFRFT